MSTRDALAVAESVSRSTDDKDRLKSLLEFIAEDLGAERARFLGESRLLSPVETSLPRDGGETAFRQAQAVASGVVEFESSRPLPDRLPAHWSLALAAAVRAYELADRLRREQFEVNYKGVELEALYDVGLAIASTLDLEELTDEVLLRAVALLDASRGALYRAEEGELVLEKVVGGDALERAGKGDIDRLLPGCEHLLTNPIGVEKKARGLLVVGDKESRQGVGPFGDADRRTLAMFANQAAIALENAYLHQQALEKERLEREAELAAEIQGQLLPERPAELAGFGLAGWNEAARFVGGDYYNYFPLSPTELLVVLADVTGKGMPAALLVSTLDSALRLLIARGVRGIELVEALNGLIWETTGSNTFITMVAVQLEAGNNRASLVSAGHNPVVVVAGESSRLVNSTGMPLGLFQGASYGSEAVELGTGDVLCVYSDGITESASPADEEFGVERLVAALARERSNPLETAARSIVSETHCFSESSALGDDQTLVLIQRT